MELSISGMRGLLHDGRIKRGMVIYMIKTYIIDIRQLEDEALFTRSLEAVSPYRRQKIALLKNENDKRRSLGAAIALNEALSDYGLKERAMEYEQGRQGKPFLRYHPEINFSISHSGDYALCSVGNEPIGNDIERVRSGRERVAERFFAEKELAWIRETEEMEEREERIFRIWTMKESFLKVTGLGMSLPLKDFEIVIENDEKICLHQNIDEKTYFMKEYAIPVTIQSVEKYKLSVCSPSPDFEHQLHMVFAS